MKSDAKPRYLTKSRFKLALECPTKLYYTGKSDLYVDSRREDEFLQALADGGFQVGELAKLMFPGGIEITSQSHDEQVAETARLLERDEVTLFEAAIRHGNLFARVDVLRKTGSQIELIEVKAKSFDSTTFRGFRGARGGIESGMKPYLQDVAFQRHVLGLAYPHLRASSFLMLADKAKTCSVDGLNQRFKIRRVDDRPVVTVAPGTDERTVGAPVLGCVNVDDLVDEILREPIEAPGVTGTLAELATDLVLSATGPIRVSCRPSAPNARSASSAPTCLPMASAAGCTNAGARRLVDRSRLRPGHGARPVELPRQAGADRTGCAAPGRRSPRCTGRPGRRRRPQPAASGRRCR